MNFFSKFNLSVSYLVFKTNPLLSILFTFATNLSYKVFLTTLFLTASLGLLKSTEIGINLSISNLSTSVYTLAKFYFSAKLGVSITVAFLNRLLFHN